MKENMKYKYLKAPKGHLSLMQRVPRPAETEAETCTAKLGVPIEHISFTSQLRVG